MNRTAVWLAVNTGVPPATWLDEGEAAMSTAVELIDEQRRAANRPA